MPVLIIALLSPIGRGLIDALKRMRKSTPEHVAGQILDAVRRETAELTIN